MQYSDYAIEQLLNRLAELFNKKSTPKKTAGLVMDAIYVIKQLQKAAALPPNPPLTLDELRKMNGEPVWISNAKRPTAGRWAILEECWDLFGAVRLMDHGNIPYEDIGVTISFYRRRPEVDHE